MTAQTQTSSSESEDRIKLRKEYIMRRRKYHIDDAKLEWLIESQTKSYINHAVRRAIALGLLIRHACEQCGENRASVDSRDGIRAHHVDYNRPLLIQWLCGKCHKRWHMISDAIRPARDILALKVKDYLLMGLRQEFDIESEPVAVILNKEAKRKGVDTQ